MTLRCCPTRRGPISLDEISSSLSVPVEQLAQSKRDRRSRQRAVRHRDPPGRARPLGCEQCRSSAPTAPSARARLGRADLTGPKRRSRRCSQTSAWPSPQSSVVPGAGCCAVGCHASRRPLAAVCVETLAPHWQWPGSRRRRISEDETDSWSLSPRRDGLLCYRAPPDWHKYGLP